MMRKVPRGAPRFRFLLTVFLVIAFLLVSVPATPAAAQSDPASGPDAARVIDMIKWLRGEPLFQTTRIYDRNGELLAELDEEGRRTIVGFDEIPEFLIKATIATEDRRFYEHGGIDYLAIARAAWQNSQSDTIVSGGSTITQQLARLLFMPPSERYEQSLMRKLKEAQLAMDLERYYSKNDVLAMYLNTVYYGHRAYGVAAAAETYFNKSLSELTPAESALLAGLPQSPVMYDPLENPAKARERQKTVLSLMVQAGYIDAAQAAEIEAQPLNLHPYQRPQVRAPHFVDYVRSILVERFGTQGVNAGYQVYTSLDLRYQELAERIARAQVATAGPKYKFTNAAVVMLHPQNGQILAMVGSVDFYNEDIDGQVNMAIEPRQPGSSIKPVIYAAAFDRGWSPASIIWDVPVFYKLNNRGIYSPHNITWKTYGPLRLRMALSNSLNIPAVKLLDQVGIPAALDTARKLGITSWTKAPRDYGLSLAVGGYEVPLLDLTHAFATIANQGVFTPLHAIIRVEDSAGRTVYEMDPDWGKRQAISPVAAYQLASVLSDARARKMMFHRPSPLDTSQIAAAKTGTTDGWRDNLTVGFTSYLTVGVWTGNTDGKPMDKAIGLYTAGPIWHDIMEGVWANPALYNTLGYLSTTLPKGFTQPPNTKKIPVCTWMPGKFRPRCPRMQEEVYPIDVKKDPPTGRKRGYCMTAGAEDAPVEAYFLYLPEDRGQAARARSWMRNHFNRAVENLSSCDTTPRKRKLVEQPELLPPRQLVKMPEVKKVSVDTSEAASQTTQNGE